MRYYRRNSDSAIQKALEGTYHRSSSRSRYAEESSEDEVEDSVGEPTSQEEILIKLMEAYRAAEDDPAAQRVIMQRIRKFATRNNPGSCQCYARNPDEEWRLIERRLAQDPDNLELRLQMLVAKQRAGRVMLDNVLVRLAGFLGDTAVRRLTQDAGIKETWGTLAPDEKFPRLMIKRLLEPAHQMLGDQPLATTEIQKAKIEIIAGVTAFLLPFDQLHTTTSLERIALCNALRTFIITLGSPIQGALGIYSTIPYQPDDSPLTLILWAYKSVRTLDLKPHQRNLWLDYLENAGNVLRGIPRPIIYQHWKPVIDSYLYAWDRSLPTHISLYPYLT